MKQLIAIVGLVLGLCQAAWAVDVAGVKVDDEINFAGQKLYLNGAGVRFKFGFQIYVCALYVPQKQTDTKLILAEKGPKRVVVTMLREISSDDLGDALLSGIRKNSTPEETRKFGIQLVALGQLFGNIPRLKKGESFSLDFNPATGTSVIVDGKQAIDPLPDEAFFDALLRIWIGDNPADSRLKPILLGLKPETTTS